MTPLALGLMFARIVLKTLATHLRDRASPFLGERSKNYVQQRGTGSGNKRVCYREHTKLMCRTYYE